MGSLELPLRSTSFIILLIALIAWKTSTYYAYRRKTRGCSLPPGPEGEPILGHLRIIPASNPEYYYQQLSKKLGSDILSFNVLGQPVIVLNSVEAAVDLLDKRGANYCDRPRFVLFEQMGWRGTLTVRHLNESMSRKTDSIVVPTMGSPIQDAQKNPPKVLPKKLHHPIPLLTRTRNWSPDKTYPRSTNRMGNHHETLRDCHCTRNRLWHSHRE